MSRVPHAPLFVREMGLPARFAVYVLVCLFLLALDARYSALGGVRAGVNALLHPLQLALAWPLEWIRGVGAFFVAHGDLVVENERLRRERDRIALAALDRVALAAENERLRELHQLPAWPGVTPLLGEIVATVPDPFARRVVINRGHVQGVRAGWPVVDAAGLVGQVTRVYPWSAEVTLITDRDQGAPVQNLRNGLRIIVSGMGSDNLLMVRFLDMHADLAEGDWLYTSGIDGVYPAGIPVARVVKTETPRASPFASAYCVPIGGVGRYRHVAVLKPVAGTPAATEAAPAAAGGHR